jgi:UDP-N-acetylglucosamine 2-epimerase
VNPRKPVTALSNRELLEETTEILRGISDTLAEFEPLLVMVRGMSGTGASYVKAAGMRRAIKRGTPDAARP